MQPQVITKNAGGGKSGEPGPGGRNSSRAKAGTGEVGVRHYCRHTNIDGQWCGADLQAEQESTVGDDAIEILKFVNEVLFAVIRWPDSAVKLCVIGKGLAVLGLVGATLKTVRAVCWRKIIVTVPAGIRCMGGYAWQ